MTRHLVLAFATALVFGPVALGQSALRIVVLEGEDGVNIVDKQTAVQPVVLVRDQNNLPVAGASVVFRIAGRGAQFAGRSQQLTLTSDAAGRAAVSGLNPTGTGRLQIQVRATFQRQVATTTIHQTNFATQAAAQAAGVTTAATGGAAAGATAGAAAVGAATSGASAGGGLSAVAIGGIAAGAVGGSVVAVKAVKASKGDNEDSAWTISFTPNLNATPCLPAGAATLLLCGSGMNLKGGTSGSIESTFGIPAVVRVDGTFTATTMNGTLTCIGGGNASGVLVATRNGATWDGTMTLGAQTISIQLTEGLGTPSSCH